jgi:radical SAM superfamily enzyme YgiQ (UPF0313 family)
MKILFIHTYDYHEPIGIMMLSSYLKKEGHICELLDLEFERNYIKKIKQIKPDIIAYSILTVNYKFYLQINRNIQKQYPVFSVFGGTHTTFFPDFINENGVDAICVGEGEEAFAELVNAIESKKDYTNINNINVKYNGEIFKNKLRNLTQNLDDLPYPDRELINKYKHYKLRTRVRSITTRGCPYNCTYCFNHSFRKLFKDKGKYVRRRSVDNVINELIILKQMYHPHNIEFHDDVFILDKKWLNEFCVKFKDIIDIPYDISLRVELVTEDIVAKLKKSGCKCIHFGIESGNNEIRTNLLNRKMTDDQIISASLLFKKYKIKTKSFNIVGLPGETVENVFETILLNIKSEVSYAINTIYHPYPQTELAKYSIDNNYYDGKLEKIDKSLFYGKSVINTPGIKKIIRLHYLFAFCVKFPILIPFTRLLIQLPLNILYRVLFFLYRSYSVIFIYKQLSLRELFIFESNRKK